MAANRRIAYLVLFLLILLAMAAGCFAPAAEPTPAPTVTPTLPPRTAPAPSPKPTPTPTHKPAPTPTPTTPSLTITTVSLPDGVVGAPYRQTLGASGGSGTYTWSISAGSLPAGLSLGDTGVISGKPTTAGTPNFTVRVADGITTVTKPLTINVRLLPLSITTASLSEGNVGMPYEEFLAAFGGSGTYTWSISAGSLPDGLSLNAGNGAISGKPARTGTFDFTVQVADGVVLATKPLSISVERLPLSVATFSLSDGNVGVAYEQTLAAFGGSGTYTWAIFSGSLPDGLSLNAGNGAISGKPTRDGTFNFTVRVADGITTATKPLSIKTNPKLTITTTSLPNGNVAVAYEQTLTAAGGSGAYTWSLSAGSLPDGLSLSGTGVIGGTPTTVGTSNFTIQVVDGITTVAQLLSITTISPVPIITTIALSDGAVDVAYEQTLTASGGRGIYTWSISDGSLPEELSLDADTGVIFGTPEAIGTSDFTVQVTDGITTASKPLSIKINPALTITTVLPNGNFAFPYSQTLAATGGTGTYTWSISVGSLPDGLLLIRDTGVIYGQPTTIGVFNFTLEVADGVSTATKPMSVRINSALLIATTSLPNSDVGVDYEQTLTASGGSGSYTWSISAGSLPTGLSLSLTAGTWSISGTSTTAGTFDFTVQVTDRIATVTQPMSIKINPRLIITAASLPNGDAGIAYSQTLTASGGSGYYTWSVPSGSLPAGLSLNADTGAVYGTSYTASTSNFSVRVADGITTATQILSIKINPALTITTTLLPDGGIGIAYSRTLAASGGSGIYTWSISAGSLPAGLSLSGTGIISGTPATAGTSNFTIQVGDGIGTVTKAMLITIR